MIVMIIAHINTAFTMGQTLGWVRETSVVDAQLWVVIIITINNNYLNLLTRWVKPEEMNLQDSWREERNNLFLGQ